MTIENQGNGMEGVGRNLVQLGRLERQVERGSLFTHTALSNNAERIHEAESFLYGLIDVLVAQGLTTPDEIYEAAKKARSEMDAKGETLGPGVALRVDGERSGTGFAQVNCAERIHLCKAACCKLNFALSAEEVESGKVKWDLGQPYYIRQEASNYCTHYDTSQGGCTIYDDRPSVCRHYSCANDERIWKDFEKMEINEEWLKNNLAGGSTPRLARALMRPSGAIESLANEPEAVNSLTDENLSLGRDATDD